MPFDLAPLLHLLMTALSLFAMGWWPCAPCKGEACEHCAGGSAPEELEVEIAGLADDECYNCGDLNGVYVLTYIGSGPAGCCWKFSFANTCGFNVLVACISHPIALEYQLEVSFGLESGTSDIITWLEEIGDYAPNCEEWSSLDVPITSQVQAQCDDISATCSVTAL